MPRLLVVADDLTGALDTGIQFAKRGIETRVFTNADVDFSETGDAVEVVVVNTKSRHLLPNEAYRIVFELVEAARRSGVGYFYKKTDSALRGNVGAELSAMQGALNGPIAFIPAYPAMGRTTVGGIHYVDGIPVAESSFGRDPFTPVLSSDIEQILLQSGAGKDAAVEVFDAETDEDLFRIAELLKQQSARVFAGCAGFAAFLPEMISFHKREVRSSEGKEGLLVVTGSVNTATLKQIDRAEQAGFPSLVIPKQIKIARKKDAATIEVFAERAVVEFAAKGRLIIKSIAAGKDDFIATGEEGLHGMIARNIGRIAAILMERLDTRFFLIGGDVLIEAIEQLEPDSVEPLSEPLPGVVFVKLRKGDREIDLYTKSGGFGDSDVILKIEKCEEKCDETE